MSEETDIGEINVTYNPKARDLFLTTGDWWITLYVDDIVKLRDFLNQLEL